MIHQYQNNGYNIVLDVVSGAVHVVDELCYDVIAALSGGAKEPTAAGLRKPEVLEELVQKLLEYKMYKYMSYELRERLSMSGRAMYKPPTIPEEVAKYEVPVDLEDLVGDLTLKQLNDVFQAIMRRQTEKIDPIRSKFGRIEQEEVSLDEKMAFVRTYALEKQRFLFSALMEGQRSRIQMIVTFLAVLELMKTGELSVAQEHPFDDMLIEAQM